MTDADNDGANVVKINGNLKKKQKQKKNRLCGLRLQCNDSSTFLLRLLFHSTINFHPNEQVHSIQHESSKIKEKFQFWSKANEMLSFLNF